MFTESVLVSLLITIVVIGLLVYLVDMLPMDARFKMIARVIVIVLGILSLLRYL